MIPQNISYWEVQTYTEFYTSEHASTLMYLDHYHQILYIYIVAFKIFWF